MKRVLRWLALIVEGPHSVFEVSSRALCAARNHHPRYPSGHWTWGYSYYCDRCRKPVDPWGSTKAKLMAAAVGENPTQERVAAVARS